MCVLYTLYTLLSTAIHDSDIQEKWYLFTCGCYIKREEDMMKKLLGLFLVLFLIAGGAPIFAQPTDLEIEEAFSLSFQAFFLASMQSAFGMVIPGVEVDDTGITFTDLDLAALELAGDSGYTTLSGTIIARNDSEMVADIMFTSGPVRHLAWEIQNFDTEENFVATITADGKNLILDSSRFDAE